MKKIQKLSLIDYISIVGYYADVALVSTHIKKQCRGKTLAQLLAMGLYTPAVRYASYTKDNNDYETVIEFLESASHVPFISRQEKKDQKESPSKTPKNIPEQRSDDTKHSAVSTTQDIAEHFINVERVFGLYTDAVKVTKKVIYL